ncbi:hypothetical protein CANINC_000952 [Pichia inconspicua]|uniref:Uncharacterized protein n=1 Tax=Pichia inconspicua TaxID=52247 RepID=A0A4T0X4R4_9ASCO|nr:hypothetical protein CANINC_000952 [[Candida] inconspicua]
MQTVRRYTNQVIRQYSTDTATEVPLVSKKLTPLDYRTNKTDSITKILSLWIKEHGNGELKDKFHPFRKLYTNPIRQKLPEEPANIKSIRFTEIGEGKKAQTVKYFNELVRFSYPNKFTLVYKEVQSLYKKFRSYTEIKDAYFYFHVKKNNTLAIGKLLRNDYYYETPATYLSLLDSFDISKNSKNSLKEINSLMFKLRRNRIPVTNELLYKLYYTIPRQCRGPIKEVYEPFDLEYNYPKSFDEWKQLLEDRKVQLSHATYIQLVNSMIREFRIIEGLNLIYKLVVFYKVEIPPALAKFTVDQILSHEPDLGLPAALYMQRISGCQLKQYAALKITRNLTYWKDLNENILELIKQFVKFNADGKKGFIDSINERVMNDSKLLEFWELPPNEEISKIWSQTYEGDDNFFKPGTDFDKINEITNLFPTNIKILRLIEEIDELLINDNKIAIWNEKLNNLKHDKAVFIKGCNYVIQKLILNYKFSEIVTFIELLKPEFNLEYENYLRLINAIIISNKFERDELEFCTMLLSKLELYHTSFKKEFLDKNPVLNKILDASNNAANKELLEKSWLKYVEEVKKDASFEKIIESL